MSVIALITLLKKMYNTNRLTFNNYNSGWCGSIFCYLICFNNMHCISITEFVYFNFVCVYKNVLILDDDNNMMLDDAGYVRWISIL